MTGARHVIQLDPSNTVEEAKYKYYLKTLISVDQQRLIYGGKQLEDKRRLREYNVPNGAVIMVVIRLRGSIGIF